MCAKHKTGRAWVLCKVTTRMMKVGVIAGITRHCRNHSQPAYLTLTVGQILTRGRHGIVTKGPAITEGNGRGFYYLCLYTGIK